MISAQLYQPPVPDKECLKPSLLKGDLLPQWRCIMQDIQPVLDPSSQKAFMRTKHAPKVKQACDCCHARKIKCDGQNPCNNCTVTELSCTYLSVPKKKGPKGPSKRTPRAVLKMQAEQQQRSQTAQADFRFSSLPPSRSSTQFSTTSYDPSKCEPVNEWAAPMLLSPDEETPEPTASSVAHDFAPVSSWQPSPLLTLEVAEQFVAFFFQHKYCITPILNHDSFRASLPTFRSSAPMYALVAALCASMVAQIQPSQELSPEIVGCLSTDFFITEAKRARVAGGDYIEHPTLADIHTSFFIFAGLFDLDRHNSAWFYLREAITLTESLRLHEEESYLEMDPVTAVYSRRTFWLLFVTERAYALQRHRPLALNHNIDLPSTSPYDPDDMIICGFLDLVSMFKDVDSKLVSTWNLSSKNPALRRISNGAIDPSRRESAAHMAALQSKLARAIPYIDQRIEAQKADLSITNLWLRTTLWQHSLNRGHLSTSSNSEYLSFGYPVSLAREFAVASSALTPEAFDANGPGILEKVFEIGCALTDVVSVRPDRRASMEVGPQEYLAEMIRVLSITKAGHKYRPLLLSKAEECFGDGLRVIGHLNRADTALSGGKKRVTEIGVEDEAGHDGELLTSTEWETTHPSSATSETLFSETWAIGDDGRISQPMEPIVKDEPLTGAGTDEEMYDFGNLGNVSSAWLESLGSLGGEITVSSADVPPSVMPQHAYYM